MNSNKQSVIKDVEIELEEIKHIVSNNIGLYRK